MALKTSTAGEKNGGKHVRPLKDDEFSVTQYGEKCHSDLGANEKFHSDLSEGGKRRSDFSDSKRCHSLKGTKNSKSNGKNVGKCRSEDCDADICRSDVLDSEKCDIDRFRDMTDVDKCRNDRFALENEKRRKLMHSTTKDVVDVATLQTSTEEQVCRFHFFIRPLSHATF
jgi:hypothetical protein